MSTTNIVLVHGGGMGAWAWDETRAELYKRATEPIRCLPVEVPGCGAKRGRSGEPLDNCDIAEELVQDIVRAGMQDVVLVGHSQAGQLIPLMVKHSPELFARLIYVSCSAPLPGRSIMDTFGQGPHDDRADQIGWPVDLANTPLMELFRAMFCNDMGSAQQEAFLAKLAIDEWPSATYSFTGWVYDHLGSLPATYVVCRRDQVIPPTWQRRFANTLRVNRTVDLDAGHQAMNTQPYKLATTLLEEIGS